MGSCRSSPGGGVAASLAGAPFCKLTNRTPWMRASGAAEQVRAA
jgi:hypothetical protein